ncbi:gamma-interferon-inducible lysosomal thiol reductase-like isoform X2 [Schistocerca gregaria]|uniref:gamma-interferon-inducible lysosomal thiol reductase-like isoform X2 n=1 Tax=Schistocerca gregaria TaxID=7010 RepID=UPI00211E8101|nr:gamma-interferon-inducible lysosomal thiol reductase-like isoform X2 [Schistocerca gregaria]
MLAACLLVSACLLRLLSAQEPEHLQRITENREGILPVVANFTPVDVAVYYETLCSDSRNFIIQQLLPSYLKGPQLLNVTLIPYGKAQTWLTPWGYVFTCQHGPTECQGNKIHACAAVIVQDKEQQLRFVECMIRNDTVPEAAGQECSRGLEGTGLLKRCGDATHSLDPSLTFVPTVTLNGIQGNQTAIRNDFWREVCAIFPEPKPTECTDGRESTDAVR